MAITVPFLENKSQLMYYFSSYQDCKCRANTEDIEIN